MKTTIRPNSFARVASLFGFVLLSMVSIAQGQAPDSQPADGQVLIAVSAVDSQGRSVKALTQAHFALTVEKTPQQIGFFNQEEDEPASVAFMIDTSGSMTITTNSKVNKVSPLIPAIANFIRLGSGANQYSILGFSNEARVEMDWTRDGQAISSSLRAMAAQSPKGKTAFHDACQEMMNLMRRAAHRRKVVILLSDGEDNISKQRNFGKVRHALRESGLLIYSINIGSLYEGSPAGSPVLTTTQSAEGGEKMEAIAADSGGLSFAVLDRYSLNAAFEVISITLRNQYVIGFKPTPPAKPESWRKLKIELKLPPEAARELKSVSLKYPVGFLDPNAQK